MKRVLKIVSLLGILALLSMAAFGCGGGGQQEEGNGEQNGEQQEAKGEIELGYVQWESEIASTHVLAETLERAGYDVQLTAVDAGVLWSGIADGSIDAMCSAWLPATQKDYWEKYEGDVDNLGPSIEGCKIGLVVPEYVEIDSIEELNDHADKFDGQITGIESGAGVMQNTEDAIEEYDLDLELKSSSSAAMTASLENAIQKEEWEVVTGWTPHWKFIEWDLKYLEDPKEVYGGEERVDTVVRKGLKEDMPEAYEILDRFYWTPEDMGEVMLMNNEGTDPEKSAEKWCDENEDKVNEWIEGE